MMNPNIKDIDSEEIKETMLAPIVAARLAAKLAAILCKIKYCDPLDEIWVEN